MKYCTRCLIPDTRPNVDFDAQGVCSACRNHARRPQVDWKHRRELLNTVIQNAKKRSTGYDCVIPVSGGKDSTWQVVKCLEFGLNPLCVTWKTPGRTEIGRRNLENLISLGVDHIDYQISPKTEKKFMLKTLEQMGSTAIPMHLALFNIPLKIALQFQIPLIIWGENSAFEYGNAKEEEQGFKLDSAWLKKYGVTNGTSAENWVSTDLTKRELTPYFGPTEDELNKAGISAIFLGYYLEWDPKLTFEVARSHGFSSDQKGPKTGLYDFADIDDDFISIHHFLKWYKFGFTRLFDNLSLEIRNQRLTREEAIEIVKKKGDQTPVEDIEKFCAFSGITSKDFFKIIEKFRNQKVWVQENGQWKIPGFLIPNWPWENHK